METGFHIGNVWIPGSFVLGPMAGVTDLPFRLLCKEQGADLVYTEMISAKGIYYHNKNTSLLMATDPKERPLALQLFGSEPELMAEIAAQIEEEPFDILDINMGCPVPKVVGNGEGSALMKTPELAAQIVLSISRRIQKPVTVKLRKGFGMDEDTAVDFALRMEDAGAKALAVHGRTREQYYRGKADWDVIRRVKESVQIPVIASGDLFTPEDVKRCKEETGCDGLMLARGVRGNPWLFRQAKDYLETGSYEPKPQGKELADMLLRHGRLLMELKGEDMAMREMRKHVAWYTAGLRGATALRRSVNNLTVYGDLERVAEGLSN